MRITLLLLLAGGCGPLFQGPHDEPFLPTAQESDLLFLRTGDRDFYYVVDKKRDLCFFHAKMYGRDHLAAIDCAKVPDAGRAPRAAPSLPAPPPPVIEAPEAEPAPVPEAAPSGLTNEDREAFRRAYIQYYCSQRGGTPEPLESILFHQGLDQDRWDRAKAEFSADHDLWSALSSDAAGACP